MIVHLFAQCWNDENMLPFFFRHYDSLVDHYFFFDDNSTDGTLDILNNHRRVTVQPFPHQVENSFSLSEQHLSNACWKTSRGQADWVIVTDIDEHLFHPEGRGYLERCAAEGVTLIPALGFQMLSDSAPTPGALLCDRYTVGTPWQKMMKMSVFDPNALREIDYQPGRHKARPLGRLVLPDRDELMLFHYKYLGFEETHQRHQMLNEGLGSADVESGWAHKYEWTRDQLRADWDGFSRDAIETATIRDEPWKTYPITPWWRNPRSGLVAD